MKETSKKIREDFVKMINQNSDNLSQYNWVDITNGFDKDTMTFIICRIKDETVVNEVIKCIKSSWDYAYKHMEPKCFEPDPEDSRYIIPKYSVDHSIDYVLNQICKSRKTVNDMIDFTSDTNSSKDIHKNEKEIAVLEKKNKKLSEKNTKLEEENAKLKEQLTQQQAVVDDNEKEELRAEIGGLKDEIEYLKNTDSHISAKQAAILTITACYHAGKWKNRENLHPILTNLFGIPETHARRRLREGIKEKEVEELAKCFEEVSPMIARIIREMPEKLKSNK